MINVYITAETEKLLREIARKYKLPKRRNWRTKRNDFNISAAIRKAAEVALDVAEDAEAAHMEQAK